MPVPVIDPLPLSEPVTDPATTSRPPGVIGTGVKVPEKAVRVPSPVPSVTGVGGVKSIVLIRVSNVALFGLVSMIFRAPALEPFVSVTKA
jgi:hypothetical protein